MNAEPLTVRVNAAPPTVLLAGVSELMTGTGLLLVTGLTELAGEPPPPQDIVVNAKAREGASNATRSQPLMVTSRLTPEQRGTRIETYKYRPAAR